MSNVWYRPYPFILLVLIALLSVVYPGAPAAADAPRVVLIVLDGLRPDYVHPNRMPNLYAWSRTGVIFENHHAAYPTVTRVNASSIVTGTYPDTHGIVDNSVYFPAVDPDAALSTGDRENLEKINVQTGGNLLTARTIGELLAEQGRKTVVYSSGSTGSAYLLNHTYLNGGIVNSGFVLPQSLAALLAPALGPEPAEGAPNAAQNQRIVGVYTGAGLDVLDADLSILWISDPDHTAHEYGMGTARTTQALRLVDDLFGQILSALENRGRLAATNILVTSDHGFSTHRPPADQKGVFGEFARAHRLPENAIIVTGNCIYVNDPFKEHVPALVAALQETEWVGPLFTRAKSPGSREGFVEGTLSLECVREGHPERAPDIVLSPTWSDEAAVEGFSGTVSTGGVAGHGSASPWDVHNTLIAAGPAFAEKRLIGLPSHNTDLAPTICHLLGIEPAATMKGRVLFEGLRESTPYAPEAVSTETYGTSRVLPGGNRYVMEVVESSYRGVVYFDQARGWRE